MIQRITSRIERKASLISIEPKIDIMIDMSVPDDLLDPSSITEEFIQTYEANIKSKNIYDLQDDLMMIWINLPNDGYGEIKSLILKLRDIMINELNSRPPVKSKPRLEYRLKDKIDGEP